MGLTGFRRRSLLLDFSAIVGALESKSECQLSTQSCHSFRRYGTAIDGEADDAETGTVGRWITSSLHARFGK